MTCFISKSDDNIRPQTFAEIEEGLAALGDLRVGVRSEVVAGRLMTDDVCDIDRLPFHPGFGECFVQDSTRRADEWSALTGLFGAGISTDDQHSAGCRVVDLRRYERPTQLMSVTIGFLSPDFVLTVRSVTVICAFDVRL